jgi:osmotically-inducible protein OsmY
MPVCVSVTVQPDQSVKILESPRGNSLGERARRRLTQSPYHAVRRINVEERHGVLTLSGRMPNFFLKQMAQTAVAGVEGVKRIINRIDVVEPAY